MHTVYAQIGAYPILLNEKFSDQRYLVVSCEDGKIIRRKLCTRLESEKSWIREYKKGENPSRSDFNWCKRKDKNNKQIERTESRNSVEKAVEAFTLHFLRTPPSHFPPQFPPSLHFLFAHDEKEPNSRLLVFGGGIIACHEYKWSWPMRQRIGR